MSRALILSAAVAILVSVPLSGQPTQGGPLQVPLPLFPANNWWNTDITSAPTVVDSTVFYPFMGGSTRALHPDFGGDDPDNPGFVFGIPYIVVDGSQTKLTVTFPDPDLASESDGVGVPFYPIPAQAITMNGWVEEGPPGNVDRRNFSDRHMLIVDKTNNHLYELYNVFFNTMTGSWEAGSAAFFNMNTNNRRTEGFTSADAAGLAILPGLVRRDEVTAPGEILHAFRVTVSSTNGHVYPGSHTAGSTAGALPMGARLRLKATKDISSFPADMQKIFRAFKKYGLIVADNGSNMFVSGTYDPLWNNDVLNPAFGALKAGDFEVIQLGFNPPITFVLTLPANLGSGDIVTATLTAFDTNYNVATGYTGTVHFSSTDGAATLPVNYTFLPGDAGTHTFTNGFTFRTAGNQTITVNDIVNTQITLTRNVLVGPATPVATATAASAASINVTWTASPNATQYEVVRAAAGSGYVTVTTTAATNFQDNNVTAGAAYVYKVRAIDAALRPSSFSNPDPAVAMLFTDDPVIANATIIKATHFAQLRQAANALRATAGLGAMGFTDPTLSSAILVKATHLNELRTAITQARTALGITTAAFTDPTVSVGTTAKAAHIQELRNAVK